MIQNFQEKAVPPGKDFRTGGSRGVYFLRQIGAAVTDLAEL